MKKELEVCLTPDLIELYDVRGKIVVVVDILRATSSIVTGLAHKVNSIRPVSTLSECKDLQNQGYFAAAERGGMMVEGFDLGNSPFGFMIEQLEDADVAMTTTNGTLAINKSTGAKQIIIGSFLNFSSVVKYLKMQPNDILIHCAGWKGKINMEDSLFAGAVADELADFCDFKSDAVAVAQSLYLQSKGDFLGFMKNSSHVRRLQKLGLEKDIEFCLQMNKYNVVPVLKGDHIVKMTLEDMLGK